MKICISVCGDNAFLSPAMYCNITALFHFISGVSSTNVINDFLFDNVTSVLNSIRFFLKNIVWLDVASEVP